MREGRFSLPLRLTVTTPPPGVAITMQRGSDENIQPTARAGTDLVFDFEVVVDGALADGRPRFLGPFTQGPPTGRFVYTRIGTLAGDPSSCWTRRAKIPLGAIDWTAIEGLKSGQRLAASFPGAGPKGDPACAAVKTLSAWRPV